METLHSMLVEDIALIADPEVRIYHMAETEGGRVKDGCFRVGGL